MTRLRRQYHFDIICFESHPIRRLALRSAEEVLRVVLPRRNTIVPVDKKAYKNNNKSRYFNCRWVSLAMLLVAGGVTPECYMLDTHVTTQTHLKWLGVALFLHAALLFAVPKNTGTRITLPEPITVSLLDPVSAPEPAPLELPPPPPPPKPAPPKPVRVARPIPEPTPTPEPVAEAPVPEAVTVPVAAAEPASESASVSSMVTASHSDSTQESASAVVTEARFDASYLRNPRPPYPAISRRLHEEGKVFLRVHVLADGNADRVEIRQSSGSPRLDESARVTVLKWRFVPAKRGGKAIDEWVVVPISFHLEQS
jgi:protein TonB